MTTSPRSFAGVSRQQRQARILALVAGREIASQAELSDLLAAEGIAVSQGTLSRDLVDVGAVRVRNGAGALVYAPPGAAAAVDRTGGDQGLAHASAAVLVRAEPSANLVVVTTKPGAAQYFASMVDQTGHPEVLGTIAGDDTVLIVTRAATGGAAVADWLLGLAG